MGSPWSNATRIREVLLYRSQKIQTLHDMTWESLATLLPHIFVSYHTPYYNMLAPEKLRTSFVMLIGPSEVTPLHSTTFPFCLVGS